MFKGVVCFLLGIYFGGGMMWWIINCDKKENKTEEKEK